MSFKLYERTGKITAVKKAVKIYTRLSILYGANLLLYIARKQRENNKQA